MPLYEYRCRHCGHAFEVLQKMGDRGEELECPVCGEKGAERQLSTFAGHSSAGSVAGGRAAPGCAAGSGFT